MYVICIVPHIHGTRQEFHFFWSLTANRQNECLIQFSLLCYFIYVCVYESLVDVIHEIFLSPY